MKDTYGANCRLHPGAMFEQSQGCPTCAIGAAPYVLDENGFIPEKALTSKNRSVIDEALGCFDAALTEGWLDALENGDIDRIRDLWHRRISFAIVALRSPVKTNPPQLHNRPEVMNPPQSAAEGCEARNLTTGQRHGLGASPRATEARPAEVAPPPEFVSIGWQYKFPSIWGGHVWMDSPNRYNGSDYSESREIFARRAEKSEARLTHQPAGPGMQYCKHHPNGRSMACEECT